MADAARPLTPRSMGTPKSPRNNEAAAGAAAARPFVQRLRAAGEDGQKILELVKEAVAQVEENLYAVSEIYGVAVDVYSKSSNFVDWDLSDLSVNRMRVLCRLNPAEAREFHNRLRAYSTGRADARMYEARAEMENRLGDAAKAIKMLQEGLRVGAQPAEALRRQLKKLQPDASTPSAPDSVATTRGDGIAASGQATSPMPPISPRQASNRVGAPPSPKPVATATIAAVAASPALAATSAARPQAATVTPRKMPRLLGLGPAERVLAGEQEEANEGEAEDVHSCEEGDDAEEDEEEEEEEDEEEEDSHRGMRGGRLSTTMTTMPLSPIQEGENQEEVTCESAPRTGDTRVSIPPPGSTAPTPRPENAAATPRSHSKCSNTATPRSAQANTPQNDLSMDSGPSNAPPEEKRRPTPSGSSKTITVNGTAYTQLSTIGRTASSKVYLVHNPAGEELALKRVTADSAKQFEMCKGEVELLMRLRGQDHIIQVIDAELDRENNRIHIVMEAADMDLGHFLRREPRLSLAQLQNIWRQMLEAVQVIHNNRIVHADLKPGNFVLIGGKLKVIDFGIAKRISNDTTNISRDGGIGTLSYMAPEALSTGPTKLGRSSDIWSLGIILYQMVYGKLPLAHLDPMQKMVYLTTTSENISFPQDHCLEEHSGTTKAQLVDILERCLDRDHRRRPSLADLLAHPLLRSAAEVQRENVERTIAAMMTQVVRMLGDAAQAPESEDEASSAKWTLLADEVWEHASGTLGEAPDFEGLAPVSAIASRFADIQKKHDMALELARRREARNVELEEQIRQLQQNTCADQPSRGTAANNELKSREQPSSRKPKCQQRSDEIVLKENLGGNAGANSARSYRDGKIVIEDNSGQQRLKASRQ